MGKGDNRRPEDKRLVDANWPWEDKPLSVWDPSDPDHPRHEQWLKENNDKERTGCGPEGAVGS